MVHCIQISRPFPGGRRLPLIICIRICSGFLFGIFRTLLFVLYSLGEEQLWYFFKRLALLGKVKKHPLCTNKALANFHIFLGPSLFPFFFLIVICCHQWVCSHIAEWGGLETGCSRWYEGTPLGPTTGHELEEEEEEGTLPTLLSWLYVLDPPFSISTVSSDTLFDLDQPLSPSLTYFLFPFAASQTFVASLFGGKALLVGD